MTRIAHTRTKLAAIGAALLITAGAAGSAMASGDHTSGSGGKDRQREAAALTGSAKLYRPGHDISFSFDAHLAAKDNMAPDKAFGTFRFSHRFPDGTSGHAEARVDCLVTGGGVAVVTGVITATDLDIKGKRVGVSVHDLGKRDRLGYSWVGPDADKDVPRCLSSAPFEKIRAGTGDFEVLPWLPDYDR
jgi:hypothetical protein